MLPYNTLSWQLGKVPVQKHFKVLQKQDGREGSNNADKVRQREYQRRREVQGMCSLEAKGFL